VRNIRGPLRHLPSASRGSVILSVVLIAAVAGSCNVITNEENPRRQPDVFDQVRAVDLTPRFPQQTGTASTGQPGGVLAERLDDGRNNPICFGPYLYRARNRVERFFNEIKHCRRVARASDARNAFAIATLASSTVAAVPPVLKPLKPQPQSSRYSERTLIEFSIWPHA
jgi:transposase